MSAHPAAKLIRPAALSTLALLGTVTVTTWAQAAEIKMLASGATKEVFVEILPVFEKESGHKVVATWSGTADIKKRMGAGEHQPYDLVIVGGPDIDAFSKDGIMAAGSRVDLMKSGVGVAVRAGQPKPDIGTVEAVKQAVLDAKSIGVSTGPSGLYVTALFQRLGIADQVKPKLKQTPSGVAVGSIVANGEAELGFQQVSELIHYPGVTYVGPLPADIQEVTVFSGGITSASKEPQAAKALLAFASSSVVASVIKEHGMEPGTAPR